MKQNKLKKKISESIESNNFDVFELKKMIENHIFNRRTEDISEDADKVLKVVSKITGVTKTQMKAKSRNKHWFRARALFWYKMRALGYSWAPMAAYLNRTHASAFNGANKIKNESEIYKDTEDLINLFNQKINELCL